MVFIHSEDPLPPDHPFARGVILFGVKPPASWKKPSAPESEKPQDSPRLDGESEGESEAPSTP